MTLFSLSYTWKYLHLNIPSVSIFAVVFDNIPTWKLLQANCQLPTEFALSVLNKLYQFSPMIPYLISISHHGEILNEFIFFVRINLSGFAHPQSLWRSTWRVAEVYIFYISFTGSGSSSPNFFACIRNIFWGYQYLQYRPGANWFVNSMPCSQWAP